MTFPRNFGTEWLREICERAAVFNFLFLRLPRKPNEGNKKGPTVTSLRQFRCVPLKSIMRRKKQPYKL